MLAEDHIVVRNGIKGWLEKATDMTLLGEAANGQELLDLLNEGKIPDIVIADMNMPEMNGVALIQKIKEAGLNIRIVILSMLDHEKHVVQAFKAGAHGYLLKNIDQDEVFFAIRHVYAGRRYVCSDLSNRLLDRLIKIQATEPEEGSGHNADFSEREIEVLQLISHGYTNQQIADQLFTSKRTVEGYRQSMLERTSTKNTPELIRYALINGVIN